MITTAYRNPRNRHCLREFVNPTRPCTLESDIRAIGLILAPWATFALAIWIFV